MVLWGIISAGRESDLHSEGQGFESPILHKQWRIHLVVQDEGFSVLSLRFESAMRY